MITILFSIMMKTILCARAEYLPWSELEKKFEKVSAHPKALSHVRCFFENHREKTFSLKQPGNERLMTKCYGKHEMKVENDRVFIVVDYLQDSDQERMFLVDRKTGEISTMAVAHGRYKADFFNRRLEDYKNTIKTIKFFSNEIGSLASSSGFFLAGQDYYSQRWGRSLMVHGLEKDINDNACEREILIHAHQFVSKKKANMLSSGCFMINDDLIDHVVDRLHGETYPDMKLLNGGGLLFVYGPREAAWDKNTCPGDFRIKD